MYPFPVISITVERATCGCVPAGSLRFNGNVCILWQPVTTETGERAEGFVRAT